MSSLNEPTQTQIKNWIATAARTETMSPDRLSELESHLTDSTLQLMNAGLSEAEAVSIAISRLGEAPELAREYSHGDSSFLWANRVFWMCIGYVSINLAQAVVDTSAMLAQNLVNLAAPASMTLNWLTIPGLAFAGWVIVLWGLWHMVTGTRGFGAWMNRNRFLWGTIAVLVFATVSQIAGQIVWMRTMNAEDVGNVMIIRSHMTFAAQILVPIIFTGFAFWIRDRYARSTIAAS